MIDVRNHLSFSSPSRVLSKVNDLEISNRWKYFRPSIIGLLFLSTAKPAKRTSYAISFTHETNQCAAIFFNESVMGMCEHWIFITFLRILQAFLNVQEQLDHVSQPLIDYVPWQIFQQKSENRQQR